MTRRQSLIFNRHAAKKRYRLKLVERTRDMIQTTPGVYRGINVDTVVSVIGFASLKEMGDFLRGNPAPKGLLYDFRGLDLSGADFSGAKLRDADFTNCPMRGVRLNRADLNETVFSGADLRKADFSHADMTHAILHDAHIKGARFDHTCVKDVNFHHTKEQPGFMQRRGMLEKRPRQRIITLDLNAPA